KQRPDEDADRRSLACLSRADDQDRAIWKLSRLEQPSTSTMLSRFRWSRAHGFSRGANITELAADPDFDLIAGNGGVLDGLGGGLLEGGILLGGFRENRAREGVGHPVQRHLFIGSPHDPGYQGGRPREGKRTKDSDECHSADDPVDD